MKILHLAISNFYVEGYNYQENILPRINKEHGHDVLIIASRETFINNSKHGYAKSGTFTNEDGIQVVRLKYKYWLPKFINRKLRIYSGLYKKLNEFNPDIIMFHGMAAIDLLTVRKYIIKNPNVKLYIDSHEDYNNSATNWISKNILHKLIYKRVIQKSLSEIDKVLSITYESTKFISDIYKVNESMIFDFPLGGIIVDSKDKFKYRTEVREKLNIKDDDIMFFHSGKMDASKKTIDILQAFENFNNSKVKLIIAGSFDDQTEKYYSRSIQNNNNIKYVGWLNNTDIIKFLCASDMYLQPGSQSATMQNALCCGTAVAVYNHPSYEHLLEGKMPYISNTSDIINLIEEIIINQDNLKNLSAQAIKIARSKLDYRKLATIIEN